MSSRAASGVKQISIATVIAGLAGYAVTWLVARRVGPAEYALFAVFWSGLYLVVSALAGVQQEITRATRPVEPGSAPMVSRARNFGLALAGAVLVVIVATAPLWQSPVFPEHGWALVWPLAVGAASYVLVAALSGSLYGIARWRAIAALVIVDGVLRLCALAVLLAFTSDVVALAWAVALPFGATLALLWPFIRRGVVGATVTDSGYRQLAWNVSRTVAASASLGAIVGGFPLLLGLTSHDESRVLLGALILSITLARAPLVVSVLALQSLLVIQFRDNRASFGAVFLRVNLALALVSVVLAAAAWLLGPWLFGVLFGADYRLEGWLLAVLVGSSAIVGALCVSAAALLARGGHAAYSIGFAASALVSIAVLLLPLGLVGRASVALLAGPAVGLVINLAAIARANRRLDLAERHVA